MSEIEKEPIEAEQPEDLAEPIPDEAVVEEKPASKQQSVARSAGIVSIAVMFSRVLGLVREQVFAYYFGAGFLNDAFQLAFRIPNVLRDLFAEGALSAAFVKVFTDYQINKSEKEAWRLASLVREWGPLSACKDWPLCVADTPYLPLTTGGLWPWE